MTFGLKRRHIKCSLSWKLLIFHERLSRELVHDGVSVEFLFVNKEIGHTQVRLTAHHKWMPSGGSMSRNGLKQNELVAIPFVNERVDAVATSIFIVSKGKECVTIDF